MIVIIPRYLLFCIEVKMRVPVILSLLMTTLIETSVQQCTKERFEARAQGLVFESIASDASVVTSPSDVLINETYYNCLATSENIGTYTSMSVSLTYTISGDSDTLRDIRYVMVCSGGNWGRLAENNDALTNNETRTDCHRCTDTAINEEYCSPCDSSCTGLNQCYGPNANQCCSYNDDGNCVADCGMNREGNSTFHCVCSNFWIGDNCDDCSLNCTNGGTPESDCSTCQCVPGYNGTLCEIDIDECSSNPCQNNATCNHGINFYSCSCVDGFTGTNCGTNIDECSPNPCQNGGTCTDLINGYNCTCTSMYIDHNCSRKTPEEENADDDDDGLSAGAIFGIILGCIAAVLLLIIIIVAIIFSLRRQRNADQTDGPPKYTNPTYHMQTDEADLGDTTKDDNANGRAENSPLADDIEATEM